MTRRLQWILGGLFVVAGANHFRSPEPYVSMMPAWLPWPETLVQVSGVAEILGGLGVLIPRSRRLAAWGLILLLIAVFPANLNVALHGWPGRNLPGWVLWLRVPVQLVFIWCVYRVYLSPAVGKAGEKPF